VSIAVETEPMPLSSKAHTTRLAHYRCSACPHILTKSSNSYDAYGGVPEGTAPALPTTGIETDKKVIETVSAILTTLDVGTMPGCAKHGRREALSVFLSPL
jgi:hypothetical protein